MLEVYSEFEDVIYVFPTEASMEVFMETGAETWSEIRAPGDKARNAFQRSLSEFLLN